MKQLMSLLFLGMCLNVQSQNFLEYNDKISDGDEIPYGFSDSDIGLFYSHYVKYDIGQVAVATPEGSISQISRNHGSPIMGVGFNVNMSFLNTFLYGDNYRLKIADDIGLGLYGLIGFGIQARVGARAMYRVSDLLDVGAQYYPLYTQGDFKDHSGIDIGKTDFKRGFGFHARIGLLYFDYNSIKTNPVNYSGFDNKHRYNSIKMKVLFGEDFDGSFNNISLTVGSAKLSNQTLNYYDEVQHEFSDSNNKYLFVSLGVGLTF